ncbi:hypothetical protein L293_1195 [Acinetobacter gyllenbergii CIP 110306 = MTCC 11365]|nr:hypothetical protein L293_1195 [Acinetobacter gyllenbergii CIP 110306 = MTCC 11365]
MADFAIRFGMLMPHANRSGCCKVEFEDSDAVIFILPKILIYS